MRILLKVAYDGTAYHGWQSQNNGITIEETLNKAISDLCSEEISVIGASRTDAGVHALCNYAVFDTSFKIAPEKAAMAINARLPEDIRVLSSVKVDDDFHPRKQNTVKTYEYCIFRGRIENPIGRNYAHFVYDSLDVDAMRAGASYLLGRHDFKSFCTENPQVKSTVRTMYSLDIIEEGPYLYFEVTGGGFLFHMVRIIVGTLLEVGRGKISPDDIKTILDAKDRQAAGPTAPARGLMLKEFEFTDGI